MYKLNPGSTDLDLNPVYIALLKYAGFLLLVGCSTVSGKHPFQMPQINPDNVAELVWPSPPDTPRYAFVGHIYGESNARELVQQQTSWSRFLNALVGIDERTERLNDLIQPQQIASDQAGRVYVADSGRQAIFVFDEQLGELSIWDETSLSIPFLSPVGVVHAEDSIWVTDSELAVVYRLTLDGELTDTLGKGILKRPTGISYDAVRKRLFVSDTGESNIKLFNIAGELIDVWSDPGAGAESLNRPTFIHYRRGRLYVADSLNARIQIYDDLGNHLETLGERGLYVGNFSRPKGVAVDSDDNIYIAESYYDHLLIYNSRGELLMSIGGSGFNPGQFSQPTGLWVDERDRIFVSDMLNSRVSIFQYLGND